jgi:hypothetical protein
MLDTVFSNSESCGAMTMTGDRFVDQRDRAVLQLAAA